MPAFKIDLTGEPFGRWTVLRHSHKTGSMNYWLCRCQCGTERPVFGADLKRGGSVSCGCHMRDSAKARKTTHGMFEHPAYLIWKGAKTRCRNPKDSGWDLYGGRGITFAAEWDRFEDFWRDMGPSWQPGLTLERLNTEAGYGPGRCVWATPKQQANNRRDNVWIQTEYGLLTVQQAAERSGIKPEAIRARIRYGWPETDLLLPVRGTNNGR